MMPAVVGLADALRLPLPDASVDAVVTDPPYGLRDYPPREVVAALSAWLSGDRSHVPDGRGFMGREWDRFVPPPAVWDEAFRVLKPGGWLLAFAGSRTADLMGVSVRLAGFELRDSITWHYGSGFPKSLDVAKAIDRQRDDRPDVARVAAWLADQADTAGVTRAQVDAHMGTADMAGWWLSRLPHRAAVPTPEQWVRLRRLIGFGDEMDAEVWRLNGRKGSPGEAWGERPPAERADRPGMASSWTDGRGWTGSTARGGGGVTDDARRWQGWGTALKPASEPIVVARKPFPGTAAANVLAYGTGALNIDACRVPHASAADLAESEAKNQHAAHGNGARQNNVLGDMSQNARGDYDGAAGRWPSNVVFSHAAVYDPASGEMVDACADGCVPGCPVAELDAQSGTTASSVRKPTGRDTRGTPNGNTPVTRFADTMARGVDDSGGASRFFPTFRYQAKAPTRERPKVDGVAHPTVKPLALIRWLTRLACPPGGVVLDQFAGSGTTAEACLLEGFDCVTFDNEPAHLPLIRHRITRSTGVPVPTELLP